MAANQYGIDLGEIYRTVETVKGARTQNKLASLQLSQAEKQGEIQNKLSGIRTKAVTGDVSAQQELLSLDPKQGPAFIEAIGKMDDRQRQNTKNNIEQIGQISSFVLSGSDLAEQQRRYALARSNMNPDAVKNLPEQYDPEFMQYSLAKATSMDKLLATPQKISAGGVDKVYKLGQEISSEPTPAKAPLVQLGGDKKESEKLAELRVNNLGKLQEVAITAEDQLESLNQLKAIDISTGLGVETRGEIARVWDAMGGDGKALTGVDPSDTEKFRAVATKQVIDLMATQKGPQTDSDAKRIERATVKLGNTPEANEFIISSASAIANRKIEQAAFYENFLEENGTLKGADREWRSFKQKTPMLSDVIKHPETGLPAFFYQFAEFGRQNGLSDSAIIDEWRKKIAEAQ